jgi:hypothetical protein
MAKQRQEYWFAKRSLGVHYSCGISTAILTIVFKKIANPLVMD